jgi:hypothetical protein
MNHELYDFGNGTIRSNSRATDLCDTFSRSFRRSYSRIIADISGFLPRVGWLVIMYYINNFYFIVKTIHCSPPVTR